MFNKIKRLLYILVFLVLPFVLFSQDIELQKVLTQESISSNTNLQIPLQKTNVRVELDVRIEFFNKKSIEGKVVFSNSEVYLTHLYNGVNIEVEIPYSNIEMIHPITWVPDFQKIEKDRKIMFNFYPTEYIVKLKDGRYLNVMGRVPSFEVIDFVHKYGKSKIYTYYVDYLISDKKGQTKWKNTGTYELNKNFKKPHPNVAFYIYFK